MGRSSLPAIGAAVCCARSSGLLTTWVMGGWEATLSDSHSAAASAIASPVSDSR
jgi:hypothetical protein